MKAPFEHKGLKADIERLKLEVAERAASPEAEKGEISHRDIVHEVTRPLIYPLVPQKPIQNERQDILPDYAKDFPAKTRLKAEGWIDLAMHKGIAKAAEEAGKSGDPAALDAFHDAITTKLLEEFQSLGILKK